MFKSFGGISIVIGVVVMLVSSQASAMDLLQLYQAALEADPEYRSASFEHRAAEARFRRARAEYLPQADLQYEYQDTSQEILDAENSVFQVGSSDFPTESWTLSISQAIFDYPKWMAIKKTSSERQKSELEYAIARQDLIVRTAVTYFEVLASIDEVHFLASQKETVQAQLRLSRGREQARISTSAERVEVEALLASVEVDYLEAQAASVDKKNAIQELIGEYPENLAVLKKELDPVGPTPGDSQNWIDTALQNNLALSAQRSAVEAAHREVRRQFGGHLPTLDLVLRKTREETSGTLFGGGSDVDTEEVALQFRLPLFSGGAVHAAKQEAYAVYNQALEEQTRLQRNVRRKVQEYYLEVTNSLERIVALEKSVEAQTRFLDIRREKYQQGMASLGDVLEVEEKHFEVLRDLSRARYDYLLSSLRLKSAVAGIGVEDIRALNKWLEPPGAQTPGERPNN